MSKAEEILSQQASPLQVLRWAEGNAVVREYDKGQAAFLYADGSMITKHPLQGLKAYP